MCERVCFCFDSTTKMNELIESFFFLLGGCQCFDLFFLNKKKKMGSLNGRFLSVLDELMI
jgi:hypothetical protein